MTMMTALLRFMTSLPLFNFDFWIDELPGGAVYREPLRCNDGCQERIGG
jgi:hypothetical protein